MLYVYGSLMPLRLLEEIRFWKMQEKEHTVVIRELVPNLEPPYVARLQQWEGVFAQTEAAANQWIEAVIRSGGTVGPELWRHVNALLRTSAAQSNEFVKQLFAMLQQSAAVRAVATAPTVVQHIIRESEYFLGVLQAILTAPGTHGGFGPGDSRNGSEEFPAPADRTEPLAPEGTWADPVARTKPVPIGGHTLPPLPYPYDALEPHIDAETMRLHHDKHHKSYVDGLNKAETMMEQARKSGQFDLIKHWEREAAFNGAGHYLHTIFWSTMSPKGGGKPNGPVAAQIDRDFGGFDAFKKHFTAAADKVEGGGWAILVWSPRSHRLEILQAEKHQNLSQWDVVPLLPLDVWEHSYYLKYKNERPKYIDAWWNVVNWPHVNERFSAAQTLKWQSY
ncbi:Fe-Mn family superoxide dismutase [Paenibacillus flagellatus]|uniref:superoxide dismutase n=1 Tax=Paenibacillus flagellatus TaxID=2211139 RepID=A0A2V5JVP1_9BACL|nr:Fe-Mn family superoxide dismutase [Paenibacillus flagellatus]PYI50678.1 superoxide dismutase [Paenibacillus flagellatus]